MWAAGNCSLDVLKLMAEKGADPKAVAEDGNTALHRTMLDGTNAVAIADWLLEQGVDLNARTSYEGWSALDKAAFDNLVEAAEFLISKGAEVNHVDFRGLTALDIVE